MMDNIADDGYLRSERGSTPMALIGGALLLSILVMLGTYGADWMQGVKGERARKRNLITPKDQQVGEVRNGKEFGSFIVKMRL
ncbi:hypothetical protein MRY87_11950 [bacterium]|nr:hypothetical protein [bacterium]